MPWLFKNAQKISKFARDSEYSRKDQLFFVVIDDVRTSRDPKVKTGEDGNGLERASWDMV